MRSRLWLTLSGFLVSMLFVGCSGGPSAIKPPRLSPKSAVSQAMAKLDTNSDGMIDEDELESCPGLKAGLRTTDQDGDKKISEAELLERLETWATVTTGSFPVECQFIYNGKPVADTEVIFEPVFFLADSISPAKSTTDNTGAAAPKSEALPHGMQFGYYTIRLNGGTTPLPAKFNTESTLGIEVSHQARGIIAGGYRFDLK